MPGIEKKTGGKPDSPTKVDTNAKDGAEPFKPQALCCGRSYSFMFAHFLFGYCLLALSPVFILFERRKNGGVACRARVWNLQ